MLTITLQDFIQDKPTTSSILNAKAVPERGNIEGVLVRPLSAGDDNRGSLNELLTLRNGEGEPIVHVYQVQAAAGSVRAWVYHKHQEDRLAFTTGDFRLVLYDIRPDSSSFGTLEIIDAGAERPCLVTIPRLVIHGVHNRGRAVADFVNMPTNIYYPDNPDKHRLPSNHPGIPYQF